MRNWMIVPFAALFASSAYASGPEAGRWSMSILGGVDVPLSGDVHGGAVAGVPDLGPLNPALAGVDAELRIGARGHDRIYDNASTVGLAFGYGLSDRGEIYGQVQQTRAGRGMVQVGGAFVPALNTELPVYGAFDTYKAMNVELGYRHFFGQAGSARPFIGARVGATQIDAIKATFTIPDGGITIANAPFYDKGWSLSGGLDAGVVIPATQTFSVTLATGLSYHGELKDDDSAIGGLGLARINDTGSRLSMPVTATLRWDF